jgi:hypothetical protein
MVKELIREEGGSEAEYELQEFLSGVAWEFCFLDGESLSGVEGGVESRSTGGGVVDLWRAAVEGSTPSPWGASSSPARSVCCA